ncbi:MAG TPA: hypothetical protein VH501_01945 [Solirubrobacterales bacterium]|jgi:hypothetical protein
MSSNRAVPERGANQRPKEETEAEVQLETRRAEMYAAQGHAGSVPRGNQQPEREILGSHRIEWERVLGH